MHAVTVPVRPPPGPGLVLHDSEAVVTVHYARSVACQESTRGIATVVKPNRPADIIVYYYYRDIDARGSGAAGAPGTPGVGSVGRRNTRRHIGARRRRRPGQARCQGTYHI